MQNSSDLDLPVFRDGEPLTAGQLNQLCKAMRSLAIREKDDSRTLLKEEYFELQRIYEDFDNRALTIKGWAITICIGGVGIGFEYKDSALLLLVLAAFAATLFWLIEAKWKAFQYANAYRIRKIEAFFRGDERYSSLTPLQMYHDWFESYVHDAPVHEYENQTQRRSARWRQFQIALTSLVFTPYLHIIIACFVLAIGRIIYHAN